MATLRGNLFTLCLAGLVFTGSFSRLTHGEYTPNFYAYQEYHQPDDGSTAARITPIIDAILGTLLFVPRTRFVSAAVITVFFFFGLAMQVRTGKGFGLDVLTIILGLLAIRESAASRLGELTSSSSTSSNRL